MLLSFGTIYVIGINYKEICVPQETLTPLYWASQKGHTEVVKILLGANADVNCICKVSTVMCIKSS